MPMKHFFWIPSTISPSFQERALCRIASQSTYWQGNFEYSAWTRRVPVKVLRLLCIMLEWSQAIHLVTFCEALSCRWSEHAALALYQLIIGSLEIVHVIRRSIDILARRNWNTASTKALPVSAFLLNFLLSRLNPRHPCCTSTWRSKAEDKRNQSADAALDLPCLCDYMPVRFDVLRPPWLCTGWSRPSLAEFLYNLLWTPTWSAITKAQPPTSDQQSTSSLPI